MYYLSAGKCLLVSTFLEGLIFGGCNLAVTMLSAYGWILHESGPYPTLEKYNSVQLQPILLMRHETHIEISDNIALYSSTCLLNCPFCSVATFGPSTL